MERHEYDAMARLESSLWWYRALHEKILCSLHRRLDLHGRRSVLDAGCGTGGLLRRLQGAFPDFALHGLDVSEVAVEYARQASDAEILQDSVMHMPYQAESFDAIVSTDVMYHQLVDPQLMLTECSRVLRPGGLLILNLPAYEWLRSYHDEHVQTGRRYTLRSLATAMQGHPLQRVYGSYWNTLLFLPLVVKRKLLSGKREHSDVAEFPPWLDSLCYSLTSLENSWICRGGHLPFGSSVFAIYRKQPGL